MGSLLKTIMGNSGISGLTVSQLVHWMRGRFCFKMRQRGLLSISTVVDIQETIESLEENVLISDVSTSSDEEDDLTDEEVNFCLNECEFLTSLESVEDHETENPLLFVDY